MPSWLRKYYIKKIIDYNKDDGAENASQQAHAQHSQNKDSILRPAIKPPQN